jgi:light-regulated signal transduction histidine kinase (bacteriophytochrome)
MSSRAATEKAESREAYVSEDSSAPASSTPSQLPERSLELELAAAKQRVDALQRELKAAQQDFQQFALHASHDFQESLRAVNAFSQLIADERGSSLSDRERQFVKYMLSGTERMRDLLDYILIYAQSAPENSAVCALIDLRAVVQGAVKTLHAPISESGASITASASLPMVWANLLRLQQVLRSLISNAIKYRKPDAPVEVRIEASPHGSDMWTISVRDNGIGIAKQYHESVFGPFKRLHGKAVPGCGMGLTVCRRIVESHGGRIWVDSTPGDGCDFQFTLRAAPPAA